jgi:hypothetical protein
MKGFQIYERVALDLGKTIFVKWQPISQKMEYFESPLQGIPISI